LVGGRGRAEPENRTSGYAARGAPRSGSSAPGPRSAPRTFANGTVPFVNYGGDEQMFGAD
jgi:hypothetical protein